MYERCGGSGTGFPGSPSCRRPPSDISSGCDEGFARRGPGLWGSDAGYVHSASAKEARSSAASALHPNVSTNSSARSRTSSMRRRWSSEGFHWSASAAVTSMSSWARTARACARCIAKRFGLGSRAAGSTHTCSKRPTVFSRSPSILPATASRGSCPCASATRNKCCDGPSGGREPVVCARIDIGNSSIGRVCVGTTIPRLEAKSPDILPAVRRKRHPLRGRSAGSGAATKRSLAARRSLLLARRRADTAERFKMSRPAFVREMRIQVRSTSTDPRRHTPHQSPGSSNTPPNLSPSP
jgi:hypothetical protein